MSSQERLKLFNKFCKTCSRHRVIPKSMHIPDCSEGSVEVTSGGYADVSQGVYEGRQVAIKVVRVYTTSDLDVILSVSLLSALSTHVDEYVTEILSRRSRLEASPASKRITTDWSDGQ